VRDERKKGISSAIISLSSAGQEYSKPSDIYAIGLMLWELLTRRHPYDHLGSVMNEVKVRQKVPSNDPDNRPPISEEDMTREREYCSLIQECWDGDPLKRPSAEKVSQSRAVDRNLWQTNPQ
jgi:serine/threonine protein kinase